MTPSRSASTRSLSSGADDGAGGILLVAGEGLLTTFVLAREEIVIGRAPECDVVVAHAALSRRHARLRLGPPLTVEDLGSKNGTHVAGQRLPPNHAAPLAIGEGFHIGKFSFVVVRAPRALARSTQHAADALVVADPKAAAAGSLIADIALTGMNALVLGETGVGKEVLADTLHRLSRRQGAFVRVNCAAIAPALIESELFGHEKGAFTGAAQSRVGLLEAAEHGTVFLDEVGELPLVAQAKLLRAIETREVTRVGGVRPIALDVRFVAATNRDLASEVAAGQFRSDLYFRLNGVTLLIPPLRERRDQIGPLALGFLAAALAQRGSTRTPQLAADALAHLRAYDWPGNVRELKAVVERAVVLARGGEVRTEQLTLGRRSSPARVEAAPAADGLGLDPGERDERARIVAALAECNGNQTRAAKRLGISRATLVNKLSIYRIPRPRK
ncbi:MAG: sigma 54-interacting transcriptional regulator [Myxococcales bacterium]|nr:sigma 54-interacting transcriptional regulator [Myxococcales bacterium]